MKRRATTSTLHLAALLAVTLVPRAIAQIETNQPRPALATESISLPPTIAVADLVELVSQRVGVSVQFQRDGLRQSVSLRLAEAVSADELWQVLEVVLEGQGLTVVETLQEDLYRIVPLAQAARENQRLLLPRIGAAADVAASRASYISMVIRLRSVDPAEAARAIGPLLTPQTGQAVAIGDSDLLFLSDVERRVENALEIIGMLDGPEDPVETFVVELEEVRASEVARLLTDVFAAETAVGPTRAGRVSTLGEGSTRAIPLVGDDRLMLIAPSSQRSRLEELIAELDRAAPLLTQSYNAPGIAPTDLASTITNLLQAETARSGQPVRAVADALTGSVLVTALPEQHERVGELVEQITAMPASSRQTMRSFTIKNRDASELAGTLRELLGSAEVLAGDAMDADSADSDSADPAFDAGSYSLIDELPLSLTVDPQTNNIIAIGEPTLILQLESLIQQLDRRQPQVMIEAMLVTLSESDSFDFGVELQSEFDSGRTSTDLSSLFGLGSGGAADVIGMGTGFTGIVIRPGDFSVLLRALESTNWGRSVSSPKVLVNNNATATLRSVERQPFTSVNASNTVATTSFGGNEEAGTTITVTPQIAEGDHLSLDYSVELSSFTGESLTTEGGGVVPPPSQQNSISGSVTLPDGYTVVVGGLLSSAESTGQNRVPLLGRLPLIGSLFGTTGQSESRSRFYIFIRATVLRDALFEDLRLLSARDVAEAEIDDRTPKLRPLWID